MPSNLTETDTFSTPISYPLPGEQIQSVDWVNAAGALANRTLYCKNRLEGIKVLYRRLVPLTSVNPNASTFSFSVIGGPGANAMGQRQTASGGALYFGLPVIEGGGTAKLVSLAVTFRPAGGGRAGLPATQPSIRIWEQPNDATGRVQLGSTATLAAGTVVAYEAPQALTVTLGAGSGATINLTSSYYAEFDGEADGGANFVAGLLVTEVAIFQSPS